jgi:hypothetical protein
VYRVAITDGSGTVSQRVVSRFIIDRTAPSRSATTFESDFDAQTGALSVYWQGAADPALADGSPGGIVGFRTRYQTAGGSWSAWETRSGAALHLSGVQARASVAIETQAIDAAGNFGPVDSQTISAVENARGMLLVIWDAGDDETYRFRPTLAAGQSLAVTDGGRRVAVLDASNREVKTLASGYAHDERDRALGLSYSLDGTVVEVHVAHRVADVRYPVVVNTKPEDVGLVSDLSRLRRLLAQGPDAGTLLAAADDNGEYDLTPDELKWCIEWGRSFCELLEADAFRAAAMTRHLFRVDQDSTRGNAFKHSYWVALMTQTSGVVKNDEGRGEKFGAAHEFAINEADSRTDLYRKAMDIHNNKIGARWVKEFEDNHPAPRYPTDREICREMFALSKIALYSRWGPTWPDERLIFRDATIANSWIRVAEPCRRALSTST